MSGRCAFEALDPLLQLREFLVDVRHEALRHGTVADETRARPDAVEVHGVEAPCHLSLKLPYRSAQRFAIRLHFGAQLAKLNRDKNGRLGHG
jgi:hypothetical protein